MHESPHDTESPTDVGAAPPLRTGGGLESFALAVYGTDGVATACLLLQDRLDLDVDVLLFAAFFGARGRVLSPAHAHAAGERVAAWNAEVVQPLRALRRRLTSGPAPAAESRTDALRAAIQRLEIDAEMIELSELDAFGDTLDADAAPGDNASRARAAMTVIVRERTGRHPDADEEAAIARIAAATATATADHEGKSVDP